MCFSFELALRVKGRDWFLWSVSEAVRVEDERSGIILRFWALMRLSNGGWFDVEASVKGPSGGDGRKRGVRAGRSP